jgi:hypothetical protein
MDLTTVAMVAIITTLLRMVGLPPGWGLLSHPDTVLIITIISDTSILPGGFHRLLAGDTLGVPEMNHLIDSLVYIPRVLDLFHVESCIIINEAI